MHIFDYSENPLFNNVNQILSNFNFYSYLLEWVAFKDLNLVQFTNENFNSIERGEVLNLLNLLQKKCSFEEFQKIKVSPEALKSVCEYIFNKSDHCWK